MINFNAQTDKNREGRKIPTVAIFFGISLIACTLIRYLQYAITIRIDNGFFDIEYRDGFFNLNNAYYIFFAVFAAVIIALAFIDKSTGCGIVSGGRGPFKTEKNKKPEIKPLNLKVSVLSAVIGMVLFAVSGFLHFLLAIREFQGDLGILMKLATVAAALGYTYAGFAIMLNKKVVPYTGIAFLFIAAYNSGKGIVEFMQRIYTVNLTSRLIEMGVYVLLALFFLCCGRIVVRSETRFTQLTATLSGYSAVLMIVSDGFARIFHYYSSDIDTQRALIDNNNGFELPGLLFFIQGAAALWLIFAFSAKRGSALYEKDSEDDEISEDDEVGDYEEVQSEANEKAAHADFDGSDFN